MDPYLLYFLSQDPDFFSGDPEEKKLGSWEGKSRSVFLFCFSLSLLTGSSLDLHVKLNSFSSQRNSRWLPQKSNHYIKMANSVEFTDWAKLHSLNINWLKYPFLILYYKITSFEEICAF